MTYTNTPINVNPMTNNPLTFASVVNAKTDITPYSLSDPALSISPVLSYSSWSATYT